MLSQTMRYQHVLIKEEYDDALEKRCKELFMKKTVYIESLLLKDKGFVAYLEDAKGEG